MASEEQGQEVIRETSVDLVRSADTHPERSNLPGVPISPGAEPTHRTGSQGPATLFAKVVGIRR